MKSIQHVIRFVAEIGVKNTNKMMVKKLPAHFPSLWNLTLPLSLNGDCHDSA